MVNIQALSFNMDAQLIPSCFEEDLMSSKTIPWIKDESHETNARTRCLSPCLFSPDKPIPL